MPRGNADKRGLLSSDKGRGGMIMEQRSFEEEQLSPSVHDLLANSRKLLIEHSAKSQDGSTSNHKGSSLAEHLRSLTEDLRREKSDKYSLQSKVQQLEHELEQAQESLRSANEFARSGSLQMSHLADSAAELARVKEEKKVFEEDTIETMEKLETLVQEVRSQSAVNVAKQKEEALRAQDECRVLQSRLDESYAENKLLMKDMEALQVTSQSQKEEIAAMQKRLSEALANKGDGVSVAERMKEVKEQHEADMKSLQKKLEELARTQIEVEDALSTERAERQKLAKVFRNTEEELSDSKKMVEELRRDLKFSEEQRTSMRAAIDRTENATKDSSRNANALDAQVSELKKKLEEETQRREESETLRSEEARRNREAIVDLKKRLADASADLEEAVSQVADADKQRQEALMLSRRAEDAKSQMEMDVQNLVDEKNRHKDAIQQLALEVEDAVAARKKMQNEHDATRAEMLSQIEELHKDLQEREVNMMNQARWEVKKENYELSSALEKRIREVTSLRDAVAELEKDKQEILAENAMLRKAGERRNSDEFENAGGISVQAEGAPVSAERSQVARQLDLSPTSHVASPVVTGRTAASPTKSYLGPAPVAYGPTGEPYTARDVEKLEKVQAVARGKAARDSVAEGNMGYNPKEVDSAVKIQSAARGHLARKKAESQKVEKKKEDSAVAIQRVARGSIARKRVANMKESEGAGVGPEPSLEDQLLGKAPTVNPFVKNLVTTDDLEKEQEFDEDHFGVAYAQCKKCDTTNLNKKPGTQYVDCLECGTKVYCPLQRSPSDIAFTDSEDEIASKASRKSDKHKKHSSGILAMIFGSGDKTSKKGKGHPKKKGAKGSTPKKRSRLR